MIGDSKLSQAIVLYKGETTVRKFRGQKDKTKSRFLHKVT